MAGSDQPRRDDDCHTRFGEIHRVGVELGEFEATRMIRPVLVGESQVGVCYRSYDIFLKEV